MEKNKTGKYFKYAIGEIVLVVIGILIALSINNWNEHNKAKSRLNSDLKEVKSELNVDLKRLDSILNIIDNVDKSGLYLLDFLTQKPQVFDSLQVQTALVAVTILASFGKSSSAFENLINNGSFQLIKNKVLKKELGLFHNNKDWSNDYHDGPLLGSYYEYIKAIHKYTRPGYVRKSYESVYPKRNTAISNEIANTSFNSHIDFDKLVREDELLILLDRVQLSRYIQKVGYIDRKYKINNLISMIDNELETLKN